MAHRDMSIANVLNHPGDAAPIPRPDFALVPPRPNRPPTANAATNGFINAIYYANWRLRDHGDETPGSLNYKYINRVYYAFANVDTNGRVSLSDEQVDLDASVDGTRGCLRSLLAKRAQFPHLEVILSIGGEHPAGKSFLRVVSHSDTRRAFASSCQALVEQYALDGVEVCWDFPESIPQGQAYVALLSEVRSCLPRPHYIVGANLPGNEEELTNVNFNAASSLVDSFTVRCYDFYGHWSSLYGHQSQFQGHMERPGHVKETSCESVVRALLVSGVPKAKIILGIPLSAWSFPSAKMLHDDNPFIKDERRIDYKDLGEPRQGETIEYDEQASAVYRLGGPHGMVTYDDTRTVRIKAEFVRRNKLGGVFFYTGTQDHPEKYRSLVYSAYQVFHAPSRQSYPAASANLSPANGIASPAADATTASPGFF